MNDPLQREAWACQQASFTCESDSTLTCFSEVVTVDLPRVRRNAVIPYDVRIVCGVESLKGWSKYAVEIRHRSGIVRIPSRRMGGIWRGELILLPQMRVELKSGKSESLRPGLVTFQSSMSKTKMYQAP